MWVLGVVLLLIAIVFGFAYYAYNLAFHSPKNKRGGLDFPPTEQYNKVKDVMQGLVDELLSVPCERVKVTSFDGLNLLGRYYHVKDGAPLQIQFHGYRGHPIRDFCGGCKLAREVGQNVLLVDQRAQGESDGKTICFGIKERYDVLTWIDYAVNRFGQDVKIIISGVSMGGATVLEASALPLPKNVVGIISDSAFSSAEEMIAQEAKRKGFPPKLTMPFVKLGAWLYGGLKLNSSALEAVKHSSVPVLIIHGEDDRFVPCSMAKRLYAACRSEKKYLLTVANAGHGISFIENRELYEEKINEFILQIL